MEKDILVSVGLAKKINKAQSVGANKEAEALNVNAENVASHEEIKVTPEKLLVMVTGHRHDKLPGGWEEADKTKSADGQLNWNGGFGTNIKALFLWLMGIVSDILAISGMAAGVDLMFGIGAMSAKVELFAATPCCPSEQCKEWDYGTKRFLPWPAQLIRWHQMLLNYAGDKVSEAIKLKKRSGAAMDTRNKLMVKMCAKQRRMSLAIAVWDGSRGGTGNCVKDLVAASVNTLFVDPRAGKECLDMLKEQILDLVRCGKLDLAVDPREFKIASRIYVSGTKVLVRHAWIADAEVFIKHDGISYAAEYAYLPSYIAKGGKPCRYYVADIPSYRKGDDLELEFVEY